MTNFNPAGTGSLMFATDGSLAGARPGQAGSQQLRAARRRRLQAGRQDDPARRLGHLLQPVRSRRQRGSARAEPAGPGQQDDHADVRLAGVLPPAGVPGRVPERAEPRSGRRAAEGGPRCARSTRTIPKTTISRRASACSASCPAAWCCRRDFVYTRGSNLATLVNLNQPLPNAAGNNALGAAAVSELRLHRVARRTTASRTTRASTSASRSASRAATRSASPTRSASRRTTRRSSSRRRGRTRFRRTARDFSTVVRPERLRRPPPLHARTSCGTCRSATTSIARDWTVSGIYTAHTGRPFTVNQSNNNVGTNMTGLPNVDRRHRRARRPSISGSTRRRSRPCRRARSATSSATGSTGPGFQNFDLTIQRLIRLGSRVVGDAAVGHLQPVQHRELRPAEPRHQRRAATFGTISSLASDPRTMQIRRAAHVLMKGVHCALWVSRVQRFTVEQRRGWPRARQALSERVAAGGAWRASSSDAPACDGGCRRGF